MSLDKNNWILTISKRLRSAPAITLFALISALIAYTILYQLIPFTNFYSGLMLAAILSIFICYPLSTLITMFNKKMWQQNKINIQNNEVRSQLISILGHDIRSPLNNVKRILELVESNNITGKELNDISHQLISDVDNTLTLTNNLINWIKIQKTGFSPKLQEIQLSDIVNETVDLYHSIIKKKAIKFKVDYPENENVICDAEMCKIILRNVLSNSIKYSNYGDEVTMSFERNEDYLSATIADNGVGMSKEVADSLLNDEIIPSQLGTDKEKGAGIGLTISNQIINQLGGKMWLESVPDEGTTFFIEIPQKMASA